LVGSSENASNLSEMIVYNNSLSATTYYVKVIGYNGANSASLCYTLLAEISSTPFAAPPNDPNLGPNGKGNSGE
jgi:hypothetical protein